MFERFFAMFRKTTPTISLWEAAALMYDAYSEDIITEIDGSVEVDDIPLDFRPLKGSILAIEASTPELFCAVVELNGELFRVMHRENYVRILYA